MRTVLRFVAAVVLGLALSLIGVIAVEFYSSIVHPFPPGIQQMEDPEKQMEAMCVHVANYPGWVLASVVPMWLGTVCLGVYAARRIQGVAAALTVAAPLFLALGLNLSMLPYPWWFTAAMLVGFPIAVWLVFTASQPRAVGEGPEQDAKEVAV
ncbi:hypothetical protein Pla123a_20680 [Posidoniimonas polymericola]|uniref:Uncharacterized protein n=1 Tax=Posidoniimonas polymericola TaxID=2528002 RepID=A0A5C5YRS2_9BACT|nr:hypothetical protein [Posidoniimonas polymericola]TWT77407.1 hypothetical protein Pla123a_20680 [Posidoniimonas polymericola]